MLLIFDEAHTVGSLDDLTWSPSFSQLVALSTAAAAVDDDDGGDGDGDTPLSLVDCAGAGAGAAAIDAAESAQHRGTALRLPAKHCGA